LSSVEPVATVNITVAEAAVEDLQEFSMPTETIWYLRVAEEVLPETKVVLKLGTEEMVELQQARTDRAVQVELLVRTEPVLPVEPEALEPYKDFQELPMAEVTAVQRKVMKVPVEEAEATVLRREPANTGPAEATRERVVLVAVDPEEQEDAVEPKNAFRVQVAVAVAILAVAVALHNPVASAAAAAVVEVEAILRFLPLPTLPVPLEEDLLLKPMVN
jgi:hypothetical protein